MLVSILRANAQATPDKLAVVCGNHSVTYEQLVSRIDKTARNLLAADIKPGNKIVLALHNSIDYILLYFAIARVGGTIIPLFPDYPAAELLDFCKECLPDHYVVEESSYDKFSALSAAVGKGRIISTRTVPVCINSLLDEGNDIQTLPPDRWSNRDLVVHYNTPNSPDASERFKGSVQTQSTHLQRMRNWARTAQLTRDDRTLCMHPLTHPYGSDTITWPALISGHTLYLMSRDLDSPATVMKQITDAQITVFGALPGFYEAACKVDTPKKPDLTSLRIAMAAGTPLCTAVAEEFYAKYRVRINNSYGMTEASIALVNLCPGNENAVSVGRPIDGVEARIEPRELGLEGAGELFVRSDGFADRYYAPHQLLWRDGWIATGDLARVDQDGNYHLLGRTNQVLQSDDSLVTPFELEEAISRHPSVAEVAVVPAQHDGQTVFAAFIVPSTPTNEETIRCHLALELPGKEPHFIIIRGSLPKSSNGKISKAKLTLKGSGPFSGSTSRPPGSINKFLEKLSEGWNRRAQVRHSDVHSHAFYDLERPDFVEDALFFSGHPAYGALSRRERSLVLSLAWIIYCGKTLDIENKIIIPVCGEIAEGRFPALDTPAIRKLASETAVDEAYHVLLTTHARNLTMSQRQVHVHLPDSMLLQQMRSYLDACSHDWQRRIVNLATCCVSEIYISDFLLLVSASEEVQPVHREVTEAHRQDELAHGRIFKELGRAFYPGLTARERDFFDITFLRAIAWFAQNDLEVWRSALNQVGMQTLTYAVEDSRDSGQGNSLNYRSLEDFCRELGLPAISAQNGLVKTFPPGQEIAEG